MSVLGIDIGGTNIRVGLIDDNSLIRVESIVINNTKDENETNYELISLIKKFDLTEVEGIGVGVPSVVDVEKGIVYEVQNIPSWKEVHLKTILESKFELPVFVNNDANCFAVGEKYFGKGKKYQNVVGLIIGTGMGAGIILNGKLYSGVNCGAGEFGMIPFLDHNYEFYCSGQYFEKVFSTTGSTVYEQAKRGDKASLEIFNKYGVNLGEAIKMIMYALDPEIIILGGSVSKSFEFFKTEMWNVIKSFVYSKSRDGIKIETSDVEHVAILGAAALYYDATQTKTLANR